MRIVLISLATAASALAVASPASAQWAPQPQSGYGTQHYGGPGYGMPGYGYQHGHLQNLRFRIDSIQRQIVVLDRRNILSNREARRLREQSRAVERRLRRAARNGLSPWEAHDIQTRIARLEHRVHREAMDRRGWRGAPGYGQYGAVPGYYNYGNRDRDDRDDDRDDRWERDDDDD
ncbi:MAG: hypothetical protein ACR2JJ_06940 [Sphingomicrobium sp.]